MRKILGPGAVDYMVWGAYYAHAFGDDVTGNVYQSKNSADYGYVELTSSF